MLEVEFTLGTRAPVTSVKQVRSKYLGRLCRSLTSLTLYANIAMISDCNVGESVNSMPMYEVPKYLHKM